MKVNSNTVLITDNIALVPYRPEHVLKYHEWMSNPILLHLTASEPLTLEEEYENQKSWARDESKLTFIVLDRHAEDSSSCHVGPEKIQALGGMVGDVNIFLVNYDDEKSGELEIMLAEPGARGKGIGFETALTMLSYAHNDLDIRRFTAKIGYENTPSLKLFEKMGFMTVSRSDVFQEVTMLLPDVALKKLLTQAPKITKTTYDE